MQRPISRDACPTLFFAGLVSVVLFMIANTYSSRGSCHVRPPSSHSRQFTNGSSLLQTEGHGHRTNVSLPLLVLLGGLLT